LKTRRSHPRSRKRTVQISVRLHPEIHAALNYAKNLEGFAKMEDKLHAILCREFGRMDLISQPPELLLSE
jgi:hypothetical protein